MKFIRNGLLFCTIIFSSAAHSLGYNIGHRGGGYHSFAPENSLLALKHVLVGTRGEAPLQLKERFVYLEFDVHETYDHQLVVFHDKTLKRMIPNEGPNQAVYQALYKKNSFRNRFRNLPAMKELSISHLTLNELQRFRLKEDGFSQRVETLNQFLEKLEEWQLRRPLVVEIKSLHSDQGRLNLIQKLARFKYDYMAKQSIVMHEKYDFKSSIELLSTPWNFSKSIGKGKDKKWWCEQIYAHGFNGVSIPVAHGINNCYSLF